MGTVPFYHQLRDNHESYVIHDSRRNRRWHPCQHSISITTVRLLRQTAHHPVTLYYRHHFQFTHKNMEQAFYTEQAFFLKILARTCRNFKIEKKLHARTQEKNSKFCCSGCSAPLKKQDRLLGRHLYLAQTSQTTRSDYLYPPIGIIRTTDKDYPNSAQRLSEHLTSYPCL